MKKLLIVPLVALAMAAIVPAAHADHGAAQTPDLEPQDKHCRVEFVGHASCRVTNDAPSTNLRNLNRDMGLVPTADGWHAVYDFGIILNDSDTVVSRTFKDVTIPYTFNQADEDELFEGSPAVPVPNRPVSTAANGTGAATSDATCFTNITVGAAGELICTFDSFDLDLPVLPL